MTPIQKAKEIAEEKYPYPELNPQINNTLVRFRIDALREGYAAALLSGEDWISVKDRLPENLGWCNDQVLFVASESVRKGCYDYEDGFWHELDGGKYQDIGRINNGEKPNGAVVTHWMPLPEPPKS